MSVNVKIVKITSKNLRCPDYVIDFAGSDGNPCPVVLLQMPNGTGKTTTLELLRAAFAGETILTDPYKDYVDKDCIEGQFQVDFTNNSLPYTITMKFNSDSNGLEYNTTRPNIGISKGHFVPSELKPFFRPDFVKLFVFDGELAVQLMDRKRTNANTAIESLFQLNEFNHLIQNIEAYYEQKTVNSSSNTDKGVNRWKNKRDKLKARQSKVLDMYSKDKDLLESIKLHLEHLKEEYADRLKMNSELKDKMNSALKQKTIAKEKVALYRKEVFDIIKAPYTIHEKFAQEILELKSNFDQAKLPESAAREFFVELATNEDRCICGTELTSALRQAIHDRSINYLGSEDMAYINTLKTSVSENVSPIMGAHSKHLDEQLALLNSAILEEQQAENEISQVDIEGRLDDPDLGKVSEAIKKDELQMREIEARLEKYERNDDNGSEDELFSISVLKKELEWARFKVAEITKTIELKEKRDLLCQKLRAARDIARRKLALQICEEANERISVLMPFNDIRLDKIDQSLHLRNKAGGSEGETLSVAYAFLSTLFNRAEVSLPFIVDSPANAIDLAVRTQVGGFVPKLAQQVIAFTISSERENFISGLKKTAKEKSREVKFITLFKNGPDELVKLAEGQVDFVKSRNGFMVTGESFFNQFQQNSEAE